MYQNAWWLWKNQHSSQLGKKWSRIHNELLPNWHQNIRGVILPTHGIQYNVAAALFTEHQCDITGIATLVVPLVYQKESTWLSGRACMSSWYCCPTIGAPCTAPRNWAARLAVQHLECWETSLRLELLTNEILKSLTIDASRKQQRFLPKLWHMSECRRQWLGVPTRNLLGPRGTQSIEHERQIRGPSVLEDKIKCAKYNFTNL